jgi:AcrR family transcriptional regulator
VSAVSEPITRAAKRAATAQRILEAAQHEFGEHGLEATTVRQIAKRAGVDPSLVIQHYGSKSDLFAIATKLEHDAPENVAEHLFDVVNVRIGPLPPETRALVRSMLTAPDATASIKAFLDERVENLARAMGGGDAQLHAALAVSSILGLTISKHFLELDALTGIPDEQIAAAARPWITTGLAGASPPPDAGPARSRPPGASATIPD